MNIIWWELCYSEGHIIEFFLKYSWKLMHIIKKKLLNMDININRFNQIDPNYTWSSCRKIECAHCSKFVELIQVLIESHTWILNNRLSLHLCFDYSSFQNIDKHFSVFQKHSWHSHSVLLVVSNQSWPCEVNLHTFQTSFKTTTSANNIQISIQKCFLLINGSKKCRWEKFVLRNKFVNSHIKESKFR